LLVASDVELLVGKAVIEIKPRWFSKATGIAMLMGRGPFMGRIPVFLGDDTTDEVAFRTLSRQRALCFGVGREMEGASYTFDSPDDVRRWLRQLSTAASAP